MYWPMVIDVTFGALALGLGMMIGLPFVFILLSPFFGHF